MIDAINSALSGLKGASKQVNQSAQNIAEGTNNDRIIEDIVDIKVAETAYKANVKTIQVAQDLSDELLRIFDERV